MLNKLYQAYTIVVNHPGFARYFSNTSWLFFEQLVRVIVGMLVGVWVARYLGPNQFGQLSYVLAFVAVFAPIARLGLHQFLIRDLVSCDKQLIQYLGTAFWLRVFFALISIVLILLATMFTAQDHKNTVFIFIVSTALLFQALEVVEAFFQSQLQSKEIAISKFVQLLCSSALKIALITMQAPLAWFVSIVLLEQVILSFAFFWRYCLHANPVFFSGFNWQLSKRYLKVGMPLVLSSICLVMQTRIDHLMLQAMVGDLALGYYSAANRLIEGLAFIPGLLVSALYPAIINAKNFSTAQYHRRMYNLYRLMMLFFILVAIPLAMVGETLIVTLYGQGYAPAGVLLSVMTVRLFFINYEVARNAFLTLEQLVMHILISTTIGAVINVLLNWYWIPEYQALGAIYATLVSFFISVFVLDCFNHKTRHNLVTMYKSLLIVNFWK